MDEAIQASATLEPAPVDRDHRNDDSAQLVDETSDSFSMSDLDDLAELREDETTPILESSLEDPRDGDETETMSVADLGEDEMQTKTDLALLYMEMGDTDRARGFLEAVLAEGGDGHRETAREILARLA